MILVIKLGALGDFILCDSAFKIIRDTHKDDHIVLLTTPAFEGYGKKLGYFDEVISFPRFRYWDLKSWKKLVSFFNECVFTRAYDLQMVGRTKKYYYVFKAFSKKSFEWVGHVKGGFVCLEKKYFSKHFSERVKRLFYKLGIIDIPTLDITRLAEPMDVEGLERPYIIVVPSASNAYKGAKIWPLVFYRDIVKRLINQGYNVVIVGGPGDNHDLLHIHKNVFDLTGKTSLYQIISLAEKATFALGGDTGPMHMAAASKCPVFQLFSLKVLPAERVGARAPHYYHFEAEDLQQLHPDEVWEEVILFLRRLEHGHLVQE